MALKTRKMNLIYNISIYIITVLIRIASLFNNKASLWTNGRNKWQSKLKENVPPEGKKIWFHCASLGEFEQGRPLIEKLKENWPEIKIILTFFSPSGYEIRKNYMFADYICYLPADTPGNAEKFVSLINPVATIFVKYEFWNNYISVLKKKGIPLYLVSGIFRPDQHFFKWYGAFFRNILKGFTYIFVQDRRSYDLLFKIGITNITISGDTRFDRVSQIAHETKIIPVIEQFRGGEKLFLAGSTWKRDEEIIAEFINEDPGKMKWIFAPHEIDRPNIARLQKLLKADTVCFSEFKESSVNARVLIIDNIGILSSAYRYADIASVGGGFGKGIHNILEPACWGVPVLFGPDHKSFREASELIERKGAFCFRNHTEFSEIVNKLLSDNTFYKASSETVSGYIRDNTGATDKILNILMYERY
jgi:3-deoxy-D-manno-octulosonic-acid transferase